MEVVWRLCGGCVEVVDSEFRRGKGQPSKIFLFISFSESQRTTRVLWIFIQQSASHYSFPDSQLHRQLLSKFVYSLSNDSF